VNKLILIPVLIGVIVIFASLFLVFENKLLPESKPIYDAGFTFYDVEKIKSALSLQNISMSAI